MIQNLTLCLICSARTGLPSVINKCSSPNLRLRINSISLHSCSVSSIVFGSFACTVITPFNQNKKEIRCVETQRKSITITPYWILSFLTSGFGRSSDFHTRYSDLSPLQSITVTDSWGFSPLSPTLFQQKKTRCGIQFFNKKNPLRQNTVKNSIFQ